MEFVCAIKLQYDGKAKTIWDAGPSRRGEENSLNYGRCLAGRNGNAFHSINEVTVRQAELVLRWVTACGQVNHFGM